MVDFELTEEQVYRTDPPELFFMSAFVVWEGL
jgi:hypothetical protein